jgi:hypothetical protein
VRIGHDGAAGRQADGLRRYGHAVQLAAADRGAELQLATAASAGQQHHPQQSRTKDIGCPQEFSLIHHECFLSCVLAADYFCNNEETVTFKDRIFDTILKCAFSAPLINRPDNENLLSTSDHV